LPPAGSDRSRPDRFSETCQVFSLWANTTADTPLVFRSEAGLQAKKACIDSDASFDFSEHNLVTFWIRAGGYDYRGSRVAHVLPDNRDRSITFYVDIFVVGNCAGLNEVAAWVSVPVLPPDYAVSADFHQRPRWRTNWS
jgi:hypothetical protein